MSAARFPLARLDSAQPDFDQRLTRLLAYEPQTDESVGHAVAEIIESVRRRGDEALVDYTCRFDRLPVAGASALEISSAELRTALASLEPARRHALEQAAERIRSYHERQIGRAHV